MNLLSFEKIAKAILLHMHRFGLVLRPKCFMMTFDCCINNVNCVLSYSEKLRHCWIKILYINVLIADRNQSGVSLLSRLSSTERPTKKQNRQQEGQRVRQSMQAQSCDITHAGRTSQDSAEDLVGIAPAQEQSGQTDMQESQ